MQFKDRTLKNIADMICGNGEPDKPNMFVYRSSSYLTEFFEECDLDHRHDGSTRRFWVADVLAKILASPHQTPNTPPDGFCRVIMRLMDKGDATRDDTAGRTHALELLNIALNREGFEAFYAEDGQCYLRHTGTNTVAMPSVNPHRPFSAEEIQKRDDLMRYLELASEDELIEDVLLPLFRQLGFQRITASGHKDKALEYGKDIWMKYILPTQHVLYFGIQVKKGKLDASGMSKSSNSNIGEILNQVTMMLGHEIFDPEIGKKALVDHAFIIAGGEITKQARNWLGGKLDASKRSQIMFMDKEDILNLYVVSKLQVPVSKKSIVDDEIPF